MSFPGCTLAMTDLYAYTFEPPAGALTSDTNGKVYGNIFNIVNENDPVPKVAPAAWSFTRYGIDRFLPSAENQSEQQYSESLTNMLDKFGDLEGTSSYDVGNFTTKRLDFHGWAFLPGGEPWVTIEDDTDNSQSQNIFLKQYITMLANDFLKNRTNYVARYQDGIRDICGMFFGASKSQTEALIENVIDKFSSNWGWIVWELLRPLGGENAAYGKVAQYLRECLDEAGITSYTQKEFDNAVKSLLDLVVAVAANHPNLATTMIVNIEGIGQAHFPEVCLAWMQSMDSYYTPGQEPNFSSGKYRTVRINCPVDVEVYNVDNTLAASITDDVPQKISSIIAALNEDGEKIVYLPSESEYTIKLTATGDGTMNYSIQEYSANVGGVTRMTQFNDVEIQTGSTFTAVVPIYSDAELEDTENNGSSITYELLDASGQALVPSVELAGHENAGVTYKISVETNNVQRGSVEGYGSREVGTFAQVTATLYPGAVFDGWYENGEQISTDAVYRFRVDCDRNLIAQFSGEQSALTIRAAEGGAITKGASGSYELGNTLDIAATPDEGFRFAGWESSNGGFFKDAAAEQTQFAMPYGETTITAKFERLTGDVRLELTYTKVSMHMDALATLDAIAWPSGAVNQNIIWTSSDTNVVTVKERLLRPTGFGTAIVTATMQDGGASATCVVSILPRY